MKKLPADHFDESRFLLRELGKLGREKAPRTLLPSVLQRLEVGDFYFRWDSPLGPVFVAYNKKGISAVMQARSGGAFERFFRRRFSRPVYLEVGLPQKGWRNEAKWAAAGKRKEIPFDLESLSPFEQAVLRKASEIPRGEVRPYGWIAREIGRPKAVRAVGTALAKNPIPILIPCHRVIRSDGRIGEYALGKKLKKEILAAEGVDVTALEEAAGSGARYLGSDTTRIFCFPTCRQAKRISAPHKVLFPSEREAREAGYRPCKLCRPPGPNRGIPAIYPKP
jgi:O-6-methylguanine DNA methyltransferase